MSEIFFTVPKSVGMNPVAQAVARTRLQAAIRDTLTGCYMSEEGAIEAGAYTVAGAALTVAIGCAESMQLTDGLAEMQDAHARCVAGAERGFAWRKDDAPALDAGLHVAQQVVRLASPRLVAQVYQRMQRETA